MDWPAGVELCAITFADVFTALGTSEGVTLSLAADFGGSPFLVWTATGDAFSQHMDTQTVTPDSTVYVPVVDQAGWVDSAGNAFTGWAYSGTLTVTVNRQQTVVRKRFQVFALSNSVAFLELPGGTTGSPSAVAVPIIKTINGQGPDAHGDVEVASNDAFARAEIAANFTSARINAADYGFLPTASAAANDAAIVAAFAAAHGREVYIRGYGQSNPYHISQPINMQAGFMRLAGDYAGTYIVQDTDTAAIIQWGGQRSSITGLSLSHTAAPSSAQGNGIETYNLYNSHLSDVDVVNANRLFVRISGFFFSNLIEQLSLTGFYNQAILVSNAGSTGSVWNNIYVNNAASPSNLTCHGSPVEFDYVNDSVFNQLNIEHTILAANAGNALLLNGCTNMTINGLHIEGVSVMTYGGSYISVYGNTKLMLSGVALVFSDLSPSGAQGGFRSLIRAGGGGRVFAHNVHCEGVTDTSSATGAIVSTESGNGSIAWVYGGITPGILTVAPSGDVRAYGDAMMQVFAGPLTTTQLPQPGMFGLDTVDNRIYVNIGGTVHYAALT